MGQIKLNLNKGRIIRIKTKTEFDQLTKLCELAGYTWLGGRLPSEGHGWEIYKEKTCIHLDGPEDNIQMSCNCKDYCNSSDIRVLEFDAFLKVQGLLRTDIPTRLLNIIDKLNTISTTAN